MRETCVLTSWLVLGVAAMVQAQTLPPPAPTTGYLIEARQNGVAVSTLATSLASWTCGVKPKSVLSATPITNPTKVFMNDPGDNTADCITDVTSFIRALPVGAGYSVWVASTSNVLSGPENHSEFTAAVPLFSVALIYGPPVAPTNVRVSR